MDSLEESSLFYLIYQVILSCFSSLKVVANLVCVKGLFGLSLCSAIGQYLLVLS